MILHWAKQDWMLKSVSKKECPLHTWGDDSLSEKWLQFFYLSLEADSFPFNRYVLIAFYTINCARDSEENETVPAQDVLGVLDGA